MQLKEDFGLSGSEVTTERQHVSSVLPLVSENYCTQKNVYHKTPMVKRLFSNTRIISVLSTSFGFQHEGVLAMTLPGG